MPCNSRKAEAWLDNVQKPKCEWIAVEFDIIVSLHVMSKSTCARFVVERVLTLRWRGRGQVGGTRSLAGGICFVRRWD